MKIARRDVLIGLGLVVAGGTAGLVACSSDGSKGAAADAGPPPDRAKILGDLTTNVFVPAYTDSATDVAALEAAVHALRDAPAAAALTNARTAWKKARTTWKFTDAFLIGPANDLGLTSGAIDTAGDRKRVEALVADTSTLDAAAIDKLGANLLGFGGLEVLLFDPTRDDAAMLAAFGAAGSRRGVYAGLVATALKNRVTAVRDAWNNGFANDLTTAGRGSATYPTEHQGVDAVVNALVSAAEVMITLHLAHPLGIDKDGSPPNPDSVESPFADYSNEDLLAELAGIEATYLGTRNGASGLPLSAAVAASNPTFDTDMKNALTKAKAALQALTMPLRLAVTGQRDVAIAAYTACRDVKRALATQVAGALGTSLGFTVTDGD